MMKKTLLVLISGICLMLPGCSTLRKNQEDNPHRRAQIVTDTVLHRACREDKPIYAWQFFAQYEQNREAIYQVLQTPDQHGIYALEYCRHILDSMVVDIQRIQNAPKSENEQFSNEASDLHVRLITLNAVIEEIQFYWNDLMIQAENVQLVITPSTEAI